MRFERFRMSTVFPFVAIFDKLSTHDEMKGVTWSFRKSFDKF